MQYHYYLYFKKISSEKNITLKFEISLAQNVFKDREKMFAIDFFFVVKNTQKLLHNMNKVWLK